MSTEDECDCPRCKQRAYKGGIDGRCHSFVQFGDDYGDNQSSFHCELPANHDGKHQESGCQYGKEYVVQWTEPTREYTEKVEKQMAEKERKYRAWKKDERAKKRDPEAKVG